MLKFVAMLSITSETVLPLGTAAVVLHFLPSSFNAFTIQKNMQHKTARSDLRAALCNESKN